MSDDVSGDSIKTFQTLGVNISKTVRYKTITFCTSIGGISVITEHQIVIK